MDHGNHLKHMLIGGAAVLAGLLLFGVPTGSALLTAAALACPIGMVAMMVMMMRHQPGGGHGGHDRAGEEQPGADWPDLSAGPSEPSSMSRRD